MKTRSILAALSMLMVLVLAKASYGYIGLCCGKCGGNMPMNIPGGGVPETHEVRFKIQPTFMKMEGLRDGTDSVSATSLLGMPAAGKFMAVPERMDMQMLNLAVGYSFTDDFFAGLMFMWMKKEMDMKFNSMMTSSTGRPGFTMESYGMADTMLMTKYRLYTDDPLIPTSQVSLLLGLILPTGSIDEKNKDHPVEARRKELLPYGMQLGGGTFDPILGILYQGSSTPWWWGVNLTYIPRFYDNPRDWHWGSEFRYDLYGMYQFRYDMVAYAQLNGKVQGKVQGEMDAAADGSSGRATIGDPTSNYTSPTWDPDNYGGHILHTTFGLQWQPVPLHILDVGVSLPVYQDLNGPQMEEDWKIMFTWYVEIPTPSSIRYTGKQKQGRSRLGF